ncbi:MAG: DUF456 family protein [Phycisphaerales bacterium]
MLLAIDITIGILILLGGIAATVVVVLGLPGAWILLAVATVIEVADALWRPASDPDTFGWWTLGICLFAAIVGEGLEFLAGALGAKTAGSSRAGAIWATVGGIAGAILMVAVIPPIGPLIGALVGTFVGAIFGELLSNEDATIRGSMKPATGATVGRLLGTLSKVPIAIGITLALAIAAFWP